MSIEDQIQSKKKKRGGKKRKRKQKNKDLQDLQKLEDQITKDIARKKKNVKQAKASDNEQKASAIAEDIDTLAGQKRRVKKEIQSTKASLGHLDGVIKQMTDTIKRMTKKVTSGKPSPNFTYAEFDCNDGTKVPSASKPAIDAWCKEYGEELVRKFGSVHINSGYRHSSYNRSIGGEPNSVHIYDAHPRAIAGDFTCSRGSPREWAAAITEADGLGTYSSFVHADNRNRIGWPTSRWSGWGPMAEPKSKAPVPKVAAAGEGGLAATALVAILGLFDVEVPPEAAAGFAAVFAFIAGYLKTRGGEVNAH